MAMSPRVDMGELVLEVMSWHPGFVAAFTAASVRPPSRRAELGPLRAVHKYPLQNTPQ
ncbi:MAG: hypothetical protein ACXVGB_12290 [Mycobacteriaceae bacterium]